MCGILGGNKKTWNYEIALNSIKHRGQDMSRLERMDRFVMGFNRLSIIDLSEKAMQPMQSDDGDIWITYNGEIYGYENLKGELIKKGHVFKSSSDTEVILRAYCEWGENFIDRIDGMFALAIYDKKRNKTILYRDRTGIKPLYYFYDGNDFAYASELKAIVCLLNDVSLEIDNTAVFDYYNYMYIPDPKTIYKKIYKLEPGHTISYDFKTKTITNKEYWKLNVNFNEGSIKKNDDIKSEVKLLIEQSVKEQLIADVPVGVFLSGGIDSSIVTLESLNQSHNYDTFSIGFYDYESNELPYVRCLEDKYEFKSNKYYMKKEEYKNLYDKLVDWYDEPYGDTSAFPSYVVSREARKKCKVVLSGDGGDEVFGGYRRYKFFNDFCKTLEGKNTEKEFAYLQKMYTYHPLDDMERLRRELGISKEYDALWLFRKYYEQELPPITRLQYLDFHTYLRGDILTKMDRVSMAVSLEVRVPLLAKKIVEYAFSLTQNERCPEDELKGILKEVYKDQIPNNLLYRRKAGFSIPRSFFDYDPMLLDNLYKTIYYPFIRRGRS